MSLRYSNQFKKMILLNHLIRIVYSMRLIFLTKMRTHSNHCEFMQQLFNFKIKFHRTLSREAPTIMKNHPQKRELEFKEETLVYFDNVAPFCWYSFPEKCQSSKVKIVSIEPDQFCNNTPNLIDFIQESGSASNWHSLPSSSLKMNFERYERNEFPH